MMTKLKTKFYLLEYLAFYMVNYNFGKIQSIYTLQRVNSAKDPRYYTSLYNIPYAIHEL